MARCKTAAAEKYNIWTVFEPWDGDEQKKSAIARLQRRDVQALIGAKKGERNGPCCFGWPLAADTRAKPQRSAGERGRPAATVTHRTGAGPVRATEPVTPQTKSRPVKKKNTEETLPKDDPENASTLVCP